MRKFLFILTACLTAWITLGCKQQEQNKQPKYVFYFISDGTGVNTVLGTEVYLCEIQAKDTIGRTPLLMTSFPVVGVSSTYSFNSGITDSAASGTALASGVKTYNGAIGVNSDTAAVNSIAVWAKEAGYPVGIATSVSINHATPASFYAHSASRNDYYYIGTQLASSGFDFFGASDFRLDSRHKDASFRDSLYQQCADSGYVIARNSFDDYKTKADDGAEKMILFQSLDRSLNVDDGALPYAIDAKEGEMSVYDITRAQIDFLYRKSEKLGGKGFFLMSEIGGKVDYACHANDAKTSFVEVMMVDSCVQLAYEFYQQHPDETLIVITSDHETGGFTIGNSVAHYNTNMPVLAYQKCSVDEITRHLQALRAATNNKVSWEQVQACLMEDLGFWNGVNLNEEQVDMLKQIYTMSFVGKMPNEENLYSANEPIAATAMRIMQQNSFVGWTSNDHSAGLVPVYALGVGAEQFSGHNDNAEIPLKIAEIAGYIH